MKKAKKLITLRIAEEEIEMLDNLAKEIGTDRSKLIRLFSLRGVKDYYEENKDK